MMYERIKDNLQAIVKCCGTVTRDQLIQFFSDEIDDPTNRFSLPHLDGLLKEACNRHIFVYDKLNDRYSYHSEAKKRGPYLNADIKAFWVVAYHGSQSVAYIYRLEGVSSYFYYTHDGNAYELTCIRTENQAYIAQHDRMIHSNKHLPSPIKCIAIVDDADEDWSWLSKYGYYAYCVLDRSTHEPSYYLLPKPETEGEEGATKEAEND